MTEPTPHTALPAAAGNFGGRISPTRMLHTDRLALREMNRDDAPFMLRLLNDPSFLHFVGDKGARSIEDARAYLLNGPMDSYRRHGFGLYLVTLRATGAPAGICGLVKREYLDDVDIGFAFLPEFRSNGFAFESADAVMGYARDVVGLKRVVAIVSPDNERSIALLRRLGLEFERLIPAPEGGPELLLYATRD